VVQIGGGGFRQVFAWDWQVRHWPEAQRGKEQVWQEQAWDQQLWGLHLSKIFKTIKSENQKYKQTKIKKYFAQEQGQAALNLDRHLYAVRLKQLAVVDYKRGTRWSPLQCFLPLYQRVNGNYPASSQCFSLPGFR
jgi:hypothetical protein